MPLSLNNNLKKTRLFFPLALLIFFFCLFVPNAFATFEMTATPTDGGYDLRFGRVSPVDYKVSKQVTIRVNSDIGKQYRVSQQIIQPLSMMDGARLPDDQFKMYALVNSNSSGTLIYREEMPVSAFDTNLYTSNGTGDSDSFKLIYTMTPRENQAAGSYYGRMAYVLVPIDSTLSQVVVSFNVYVDLAPGTAPAVEITTNTGSNRLFMTSQDLGTNREVLRKDPEISVTIRTPMGVSYRVYQTIESGGFVSGSGEVFDLANVLVSAAGGRKGTLPETGDLKAARQRQLLYVSDPTGAPDTFVVTYRPDKDFRFCRADNYRGRISFVIEKQGTVSVTPDVAARLDMEIEIVPLFDLVVSSGGKEGVNLKFGDVSYKTGPKTSDVDITVSSNMGAPFQIIQKVSSPMISEKGDKVPLEDFTVKVTTVDSDEEPKFYPSEGVPVKEGESVLFLSGPKGESAHLQAQYRLTMRPDSRAGNYATQISYSLSMI